MTISYGGLGREGHTFNLFGPEGGEFITRICAGYLDKLRGNERVLGTVFAWHAEARRDFLAPVSAAVAVAIPRAS